MREYKCGCLAIVLDMQSYLFMSIQRISCNPLNTFFRAKNHRGSRNRVREKSARCDYPDNVWSRSFRPHWYVKLITPQQIPLKNYLNARLLYLGLQIYMGVLTQVRKCIRKLDAWIIFNDMHILCRDALLTLKRTGQKMKNETCIGNFGIKINVRRLREIN